MLASVQPPEDPLRAAQGAKQELARLLLAYVVTLIALATLSPFQFRAPEHIDVSFFVSTHDVVLNLLLMMPAGFLMTLTLRPLGAAGSGTRRAMGPARSAALVFVSASVLSIALESLQLFEATRVTSATDVVANGLGAALGSLLVNTLDPWLGRALENEVTLRLPLSHLGYLLSVLILLDSLMARSAGSRLWLLLALGLCGAMIVAAIYTHRLRDRAGLGPATLAAGYGLLLGVLALPAWLRAPSTGLACVAGSTFACYGLSRAAFPGRPARTGAGSHQQRAPDQAPATNWRRRPELAGAHPPDSPAQGRERRFEGATLRFIIWPYLAYLTGLLGTSPLLADATVEEASRQGVFDLVELIAGHTVLGYGVAEALGRRPYHRLMTPLLTSCLSAISVTLTAICLGSADNPARLLALCLLLALCGPCGVAVYRAELQLIRTLAQVQRQDAASVRETEKNFRPICAQRPTCISSHDS